MINNPESPSSWRRNAYAPAEFALWGLLTSALLLLVARRLGAFDLWRIVPLPDSTSVRFPNGFAIVDHPFHAVRGETLRRTLAEGGFLHWIGHHQGGYPVEFYPLGVAWLDVIAWGALLGSVPMMAVHKLVVIAIFLLPVIAYLLMAGFDRRSLGVGLLAGVGHLAVRGWWWSGGAMELIEWGMVTNVGAVIALLLALPFTIRFLDKGARRAGAAAISLSALALVMNPRSGLALVATIGGIAVALLLGGGRDWTAFLKRIGLFAGLTALLAGPEILALLRYRDLYYFVQYSGYADLNTYLESSIQAVSGPFFILGIAGFVVAWLPGGGIVARSAAATLGLYVAGTAAMVKGIAPAGLIDQLELTRLMPFQRFLWFFMAALALEWVLVEVTRRIRRISPLAVADAGLIVASGLVLVLYVLEPPAFIPEGDRGLVIMPTSANAGIADLQSAVGAADAAGAEGTAMLVLGTSLSWHDQLWAPLWTERPLYYDDWLWYWQTKHWGSYDPLREHAYPQDASALEPAYLEHHGIGVIVVTGTAKPVAKELNYLTPVRSGIWDVYAVKDPTTVVTFDDVDAEQSSIGNQSLTATGLVTRGEILIRRNWFPRWTATVNGEDLAIEETDDGYMRLTAPEAGEVTVKLTYELTWLDQLARLGFAVGLLGVIALLLPARDSLRAGATRSVKAVPRTTPRVQSERR